MQRSLDKLAIEIVDSVLDLPLDERPARLDSLCGSDQELRRKVESLLRAMQQSGDVLESDDTGLNSSVTSRSKTRFQRGDRLIDRYIIDELLGTGGMGEVYRALDTRLDRTVAVKTMNLACLASTELSARFQREMKATAALANNNIVTLFDFDTHDGTQFAVMEYVEGTTVRELIGKGVDQRHALAVIASTAEGLAAAHSQEVMHRDIKPENIMVTDSGQSKILDFGLARQELPTVDQRLTLSGASPGTIPYMSPEQAMGKQLTCATDIFSLGIVAFELLTGTNPFRAATALLTMQRICDCQPPRLSSLAGDVPAELDDLLKYMLAAAPENRPVASQVASRLAAIVAGEAPANVETQVTDAAAPSDLGAATTEPAPSTRKPQWQPSLVVVPFHVGWSTDDPSLVRKIELFASGIVDSLTTILTRVPMLNVVSRLSSSTLRGKSLTAFEIHQRFQVDYLIEGTVEAGDNADTLRAHVQLIDARTGFQKWAQQLECTHNKAGQQDLLYRVLGRVEPQLVRSIFDELQTDKEELNARQLLIQSLMVLSVKGWHRKTFDELTELLRKSIQLEPDFALAHALLALIRGLGKRVGLVGDPDEATREAITHAERALDLEDLDSNVLGLAGCALSDVGLAPRGIPILERAIQLNPHNPQARCALGAAYMVLEAFDEAVVHLKDGCDLAPLDSRLAVWQAFLAISQLLCGDTHPSIATAKAGCQNDLKAYMPRVALTAGYLADNDRPKALAALRDAYHCKPDLSADEIRLLLGAHHAEGVQQLAEGLGR